MRKILCAMVCVIFSFLCAMEHPQDQQSDMFSRKINDNTNIKVTFPKRRFRIDSDPVQKKIIQSVETNSQPGVSFNNRVEEKK